jgi:hypothetical protein
MTTGKQPHYMAPAFKRMIMDIKHNLTPTGKPVPVKTEDELFVEVPVTLGFNWASPPAGRVRMTKEAADLLKAGMVLSPAYETEPEHKLIGFGLIPAANAVPPKEEVAPVVPPDPRTQGFVWHLILIAVIAGVLAIIFLLIRLLYVKGL